MPGQLTRKAIAAQPEWLRQVPERVGDLRLPEGARVLFTGCGTSFHAALACGRAAQALEVVLGNAPAADVLVAISHEGGTRLTLEAVEGFAGETWLITGAPESSLAKAVDHVVVATPAIEESYCHTASYTCAVAAGRALLGRGRERARGGRVPRARRRAAGRLGARPLLSSPARGATWPTMLEAVLKLREGAHVAAEAHQTEQLLHGHLAAIDPSVRCFVLEGEGRAAERAVDACARSASSAATHCSCRRRIPSSTSSRFQRLDVRPRRGARHRPGPDPLGRGAVGRARQVQGLTRGAKRTPSGDFRASGIRARGSGLAQSRLHASDR